MDTRWQVLAAAAVLSTAIVVGAMTLWWMVGMVLRAVASMYVSRYQVAPAFPVQLVDEGEGTYRVEGVVRGTEEEVEWVIEARTRANAMAKAELRGAVVTRVAKIG